MSRIKLLQSSEVKTFNAPPSFTADQRTQFFTADEILSAELDKLRNPYSKVGFLLQWAYFKAAGRFFETTVFHQSDIEYLTLQGKYGFTPLDFRAQYSKQTAYYHREQILQISQWNPFDEAVFQHQIERLVERLDPKRGLGLGSMDASQNSLRDAILSVSYPHGGACLRQILKSHQ